MAWKNAAWRCLNFWFQKESWLTSHSLLYWNSIKPFFYLALFLLPWGASALSEAPTRYEIESYIRKVATANNLPPSWAVGIAQCESNFDINEIGDNGKAFGLWQFWENTFKEQGGNNIHDWKEQTHLAIKLLKKGQWWRWYNCSLGKRKQIDISKLDAYTLNSCMAFLWNIKNIQIKGDAKNIKTSTTTPATGFVVKFKYPNDYHAAYIEEIGTSTMLISETNYRKGKYTEREIPINAHEILGYVIP